MNIGTCVIFDSPEAVNHQFETLKENGFDSCQLVAWKTKLWTEENAAIVKKAAEDNGITISAFWCGWDGPTAWNFSEGPLTLGLVPTEYRQMRVQNLCDGSDFAKLLGVTDIVTHMGFIPEDMNDPKFRSFCIAVRTVAKHCKKNDQYLLFETGQETPVTLMRCFETVGCDNLGVNLDTANVILYGKANPVDALEVFGKYVRNLHAKDGLLPVNGHDLGVETRIGEGRVDFRGVFKKLHELGYDSYVTIEREITGEKQLQDVLYAREYLQNIISEIYGE